LLASLAAPAMGAGVISLIQLATGDALLPRFVVFGTAAVLVPWSFLCAALAQRGRRIGEERDRVLLIGSDDAAVTLQDDLGFPIVERPASLVAHLDPVGARPAGDGNAPVAVAMVRFDATVLVLDQHAQADEVIITQ